MIIAIKLIIIVYSFYSYEKIKLSKEIIYNILDKQIVTRRDPDGEKKELSDLMDTYAGFSENKSRENRYKFVSDTYKKNLTNDAVRVYSFIIN